jgi:DNA invertase Pin-like site-specific DNA recombinase
VLEALKRPRAGFRSLTDTWADIPIPHGPLMLAILGGVAEFDRTLIRARIPKIGRSVRKSKRQE